jgi:hypothetical protein
MALDRGVPSSPRPVRFRKSDGLPEKICATCSRPFAYRKKWRSCWDEVRYCSDRCRAHRRAARGDKAETDGGARLRDTCPPRAGKLT